MGNTTPKVKAKQEIALINQFTTKDVPDLIKTLQDRLVSLRGDSNEAVSLDISYVFNGANRKIKDVSSVKELMEISASIHSRAAAYDVEISRYKLQDANIQKFSENGKTPAEWEAIIGKAANEVINKVAIKETEDAIKDLSEHLDAETKLSNKIAAIQGKVGQPIL